MASMKWVPPSLVIGRPTGRAAGRAGFSSAGGAGAPIVYISLSAFTVEEASVEDTVVADIYSEPAGTSVTLTTNPGGFFKIVGDQLLCTDVPLDYGVTQAVQIVITGSWGGKETAQLLEVDVTQAAYVFSSLALSGSHSIGNAATAGTLLGNLTPTPAAGSHTITYAIIGGTTTGSWTIVGAAVNVGLGGNTAGSKTIHINTLVDGVIVNDTGFSITVT